MANPISRVAPGASIELGNVGTRTLATRPRLAIMAMEAIAAWSHVESFMLHMFVALAGGIDADAAAVYVALETSSAKARAVSILAERRLGIREQKVLSAIIKLTKSSQKDRDKLAHWSWGSSSALPDALLLSDPRNLDINRDQIYAYKESDFENMRLRFEKIAKFGIIFSMVVRYSHSDSQKTRLTELENEPEIAEILQRS